MSPAIYRHTQNGLTFKTESSKLEKDWYHWKISLDENDPALQRIGEIEYILHKTFPDRIRRVNDASRHFSIDSEGWGEFDILVNVYFKNGDETTVKVPLKLT